MVHWLCQIATLVSRLTESQTICPLCSGGAVVSDLRLTIAAAAAAAGGAVIPPTRLHLHLTGVTMIPRRTSVEGTMLM